MRDMKWPPTERELHLMEREYEAALRVWVQHAFRQTGAVPVTSPRHAVRVQSPPTVSEWIMNLLRCVCEIIFDRITWDLNEMPNVAQGCRLTNGERVP
jgi:hypothetical protein